MRCTKTWRGERARKGSSGSANISTRGTSAGRKIDGREYSPPPLDMRMCISLYTIHSFLSKGTPHTLLEVSLDARDVCGSTARCDCVSIKNELPSFSKKRRGRDALVEHLTASLVVHASRVRIPLILAFSENYPCF